jgi:uncharacterized membrane protein
MDRKEIKERAKQIYKENLGEFWSGYGITLIISIILNIILEVFFKEGSVIYTTLFIISNFFCATLSVGFYSYLLKIVRKEEYNISDIFKYVGKVIPIIAITLLMTIACLAGCVLLVIPGIILYIGFSFVFMLYVDDSTKQPMDYLFDSWDLLKGYKWDYFVFILSFIGWILLTGVTCGIAGIWVIPYYSVSIALYYDELKKLK